MLVDSRALVSAVRKGRNSAYFLAPSVRKIGAVSLAADLRVYPAYTLSAWNLADLANRGKEGNNS